MTPLDRIASACLPEAVAPRVEGRDGDAASLVEMIPSDAPDALAQVESAERARILWDALRRLPERDRAIVEARFGVGGGDEETLEAIGARLGISRERVRQIEERAFGKIRDRRQILLGQFLKGEYQ